MPARVLALKVPGSGAAFVVVRSSAPCHGRRVVVAIVFLPLARPRPRRPLPPAPAPLVISPNKRRRRRAHKLLSKSRCYEMTTRNCLAPRPRDTAATRTAGRRAAPVKFHWVTRVTQLSFFPSSNVNTQESTQFPCIPFEARRDLPDSAAEMRMSKFLWPLALGSRLLFCT